MANYEGWLAPLGGLSGMMNTTTTSNTTNYVLQMRRAAYNAMYPLTDRKIVFHDAFGSGYGGAPARKVTNDDWLDKRIEDIRIKL